MKTQVLDVLLYLFEHMLQTDTLKKAEPAELLMELRAAGFANEQIEGAFEWLFEILTKNTQRIEKNHTTHSGIRIFDEEEIDHLPEDIRGMLISLEQANILSATAREEIIDLLMSLDVPEIRMEHLKFAIEKVHVFTINNSNINLSLQDFINKDKGMLH